MNKVILIGRMTKDAELKFIGGSGQAISKFTLAVKRPFKKDETDFINCTAFGKQAETIASYVQKGQEIAIEGNIKTGSYEKDGQRFYTTEIIVNSFEFIGNKKQGGAEEGTKDDDGFLQEMEPTDDDDAPF